MQDKLGKQRDVINNIDAELVALLNRRASVALEIGQLKAQTGAEVYDPARERTIYEQLEKLNLGPLSKGAMEEIFTTIIAACREIQIK